MEVKERIELIFFIFSMLYIIYIVRKAIKRNETQDSDI